MATLTTNSGKEVKTWWEMYNELHCIEGSFSRGRHTLIGDFVYNGNPVVIYKHWSTDNENWGIYTDETLSNKIGQVVVEKNNWYPVLDENGKQQVDEAGYDLVDQILQFDEN